MYLRNCVILIGYTISTIIHEDLAKCNYLSVII